MTGVYTAIQMAYCRRDGVDARAIWLKTKIEQPDAAFRGILVDPPSLILVMSSILESLPTGQ